MKSLQLMAVFAFSLYVTTASGQAKGCDCQCSSYSWKDYDGSLHGNCQSSDAGKYWCYVDSRNQNCYDLQQGLSTGKLWSYQACYTPQLYSNECRPQSPQRPQRPQRPQAAPVSYCGCSSFTYTDKYGVENGNCKSTYRGKLWCYVDNDNKNCRDLQMGTTYRKLWSYQACN